jgi:hypothetical protein
MKEQPRLREKSIKVLNLIAAGLSYSQIVDGNNDLNYHDIFFAAEEAVWLDETIGKFTDEDQTRQARPTGVSAMHLAKQKHPRAYAAWSEKEDADLRSMHAAGKSKSDIARQFQRQPSAIESRLRKLGLKRG